MTEALTLTEGTLVPECAAVAGLSDALAAGRQATHVAGLSTSAATACLLEAAPEGAGRRVGRYAGELTLDGRSFVLEPRIGWAALDGWLAAATGLPVPAPARPGERARVAALASMLWVRAVDDAGRHGPPSFRRDVAHEGGSVRGRLDVRRTVRLRAKGGSAAASVYRARELDNPVTRIIVAADRVLARELGSGRWRTDRVEQVLAQLHTAVGRRTPTPGDGELHRMRYTPITRPFKWVAELSSRIVRQDPLATTPSRGRVQGLVLDLDGIYTEAALGWARAARPDLRADRVEQGRIVLWDRREIWATVELLPWAAGRGAPALALALPGAPSQRLDLPSDPDAAARALRRLLGTAQDSRAVRQVPYPDPVPPA
jgi:hypothetical protein